MRPLFSVVALWLMLTVKPNAAHLTLAAVPLAGVPLTAVPLTGVPLTAVPLAGGPATVPFQQGPREEYVCLYFQRLHLGTTYTIESPGFPLRYQPGEGCQWSATAVDSTARIILDCHQFELPSPKGGQCSDALWVSLTGRHVDIDGGAYCGTGPFTVISDGPRINAVLRSTDDSRGGRFRCTVAAAPAGSNVTLTRPLPAPSPPHARPPPQPQPQPQPTQPNRPDRPAFPPQTTQRPPYRPLPPPSSGGRPPIQPSPPTPSRPEDQRCDCGVSVGPGRESINDVRIYGGREAGSHEFPFVAALQTAAYGAGGERFLCGATILSARVALSAAHCVEGIKTSDLLLVAGESNRGAASWESYRQSSAISRVVIHPEFSGSWASPNLLLAFLSEPLRLGPAVGTACLPPTTLYIDDSLSLVDVLLVGWGSQTLSGPTSQRLRVTHQYVVPVERCRSQMGPQVTEKIHLCTLKDDASACKGDPGGPILWRSPRSGAMQVVGVLSHGRQCGNNAAGLSTRIAPYVPWIRRTIGEYLCSRS